MLPNKLQSIILPLILAGLFIMTLPLLAWAADLLQNDGLEAPFVKYGEWTGGPYTFDLEVAHGWERFHIPEGTYNDGHRLRYFRASAVELLYGFVEKRDGADAQIFWSTKPFDAGLYQQVTGLTIGETYGFQAGILQVYANTTSKTHGKMFRSVGIDPYGGTVPTSTAIIWGPEEGLDVDWFYPGVGAQAMSTTMTIFIRVRSIDDAPSLEENSVWVDDTFLDVAPTTTLTLDTGTNNQVTARWSGQPRPGYNLFAYEAQYRRVADSAWTDLQIFTSDDENSPPSTNSSQTFTVAPGQEYVVRARTWHEQAGGDSHEVPGPWREARITNGGFVRGNVLFNQGETAGSATVSVAGYPLTSTTTASDGSYALQTGPGDFALTATTGRWSTPLPVQVTVPSPTSTVLLTLTLRPPDDVITNGDFEADLNGWQVSGTLPVTSAEAARTGNSLKLTGDVIISQTAVISGGYEPVLGFWYNKVNDTGQFRAELVGGNGSAVSTLDLSVTGSFSTAVVGGWRYAWLPLDLAEVYTGSVAARFILSQSGLTPTTVYLDEVSLGKALGGPFKVYLPSVLKD